MARSILYQVIYTFTEEVDMTDEEAEEYAADRLANEHPFDLTQEAMTGGTVDQTYEVLQ